MTISIDYSNMFPPAVREGITDDSWESARAGFTLVHAQIAKQHEDGVLGFLDLPANSALLGESTHFVREHGSRFDDVVVLGIGGSALGPVALRTALRPSGWNSLSREARSGSPRLHVLDNVDPLTIAALLDNLPLARTLFVITSKSGGTAETMAQFLVVEERLRAEVGEGYTRQLVFITDPEKGALRQLARETGIPALTIPSNVGGRFSVLSPVGVLPAAIMGIDVAALLQGAEDMRERCASDDLLCNPAGIFATLQWISDREMGKAIHVLMPYADALRDFAAWFVQLWAESLGKQHPSEGGIGPTPIAALGATDQHSQVQLFMEGPANKTVTFLAVGERGGDVVIPRAHSGIHELGYLGGHTLGELLDVERRATAGALAQRGRPSMTLTLDRVDPWHVGGLIMLLEIATVYAGALYGVNPLDQPGVELGKQFTYAMLGRPDAGEARAAWDAMPGPDLRRAV
jgi:glucose-6-phosphate isomerase